jgi:coenzyme F420 hydrogenase subunit beta
MGLSAKGLQDLEKEVIEAGLCIMCGACLGHCSYLRRHSGRVVVLDACDSFEVECYQYCPRTPTDWDMLNLTAFGEPYTLDGLGTVKDMFLCRSTNSHIHQKGQDGGIVTTLLTAAMEAGLIDATVAVKMSQDGSTDGFVARSKAEILQCAGNSYEASFSLEAFNRLSKDSNERLGVVGLPCQVEALTKMRAYPSQNRTNVNNVKIIVGLFCGWAMLPYEFHKFLQGIIDFRRLVKCDIPHHPADSFDVYDVSGVKSIRLDDIRQFINPGCGYCLDMTSEFADISVGSGRRMFGWNTVFIRSERGKELYQRARAKGMIEEAPYSSTNLEHLKQSSLNKKSLALQAIIDKSSDKDNLLYLDASLAIKEEFLRLLENKRITD